MKSMRAMPNFCLILLLVSVVFSEDTAVEADWALQLTHREPAFQTGSSPDTVLPAQDAAGGCDGVKTDQSCDVDIKRAIDRGLRLADFLDEQGRALQTMRSLTYVQPGQTLSCVGCHESREMTPPRTLRAKALTRGPSKLTPEPQDAWPLDYAQLVQPMWDRACVICHHPQGDPLKAATLDLTADRSFETLLNFANRDLHDLAFEKDRSVAGQGPSLDSLFLRYLDQDQQHRAYLTPGERYRLALWMDTYALRKGFFSEAQRLALLTFREELQGLFETREP